ncbi:MAG: hypothetical protein LBS27_03310 [Bifidobacteriaceae bacterium]|jgi:antitoxin VapB|nr:hypothetical protein [Bifidobacteriaceae bacterium]
MSVVDGRVEARRVSLFRNGRNQAVRIPRGFELPGDAALLYQDGDRLVLVPETAPVLRELLESWDDLDVDFPTIDDPPPAPEAIW